MIPKFRAWLKQYKKMVDEVNDMTFFEGNLEFIGCRPADGVSFQYCADDIILMQSTGLKDKNGKEIFEGDIIKNGEAVVDVKNHPTLGFYTTPNGVERFFGDNTSIRDFNNDVEDFSDVTEIIGNVYENPELLEVEE